MTQSVTFATWNVNSIRARLPHLLQYLRAENAPDVLMLQELKTVDESFPAMEIEELGYHIAAYGQKTYNGVAILSKFPLSEVIRGLPGRADDEQARYIEAKVQLDADTHLRFASVYVPNGNAVDSEKFVYKMGFYDAMEAHLNALLAEDEHVIIGGDYNVAPFPIDVYDPRRLEGTICYHPREREKLRRILNLGYTDIFRALHPQKQEFSWWDYRNNGWKANHGLRIDHLLVSAQVMDRVKLCETVLSLRDLEQASDHAPVAATADFTKKALFAA